MSMAGPVCPQCGQLLLPSATEGLCAFCLLSATWEYDYTIVNILGQGEHGTVFLAEQQPARRLVVLKVLNHHSGRGEAVERLRGQQKALAALAHPNIAPMLAVGFTDERHPYVVTEYVRGIPITVFCERSQSDGPTRRQLLDTVSHVIRSAHDCRITHGGIKPSNVLVLRRTGGPAVRVVDFGLRAAEPKDDVAALERLTGALL
jgi:serine/threonine protein kinase